jgi:hypothetical protein
LEYRQEHVNILCGYAVLALLVATAGHAQPTAPSAAQTPAQRITPTILYAAAKPYMYEPLSTLKMDVHELSGLKPDSSQAYLPAILEQVSAVIVAQMPRVPNLLAREDIAREQSPPPTYSSGSSYSGRRRQELPMPSSSIPDDHMVPLDWRRYDYLIIARPQADTVVFDESRSEVGSLRGASPPRGIGFGSLWMMFLPSCRDETHFRYLGRQKVDGHQTFVVAFAQDPELVKVPGIIQLETGDLPLLYQGVVWIDQETSKMVRIRSDLLAPLPDFKVQRITSSVNFSQVKIPQLETLLWLPKQVEITWEIGGARLGELHRYSGYHLFHATSRIVPD